MNDRTVLVSIMYANNRGKPEQIQPIAEIAKIIREFEAEIEATLIRYFTPTLFRRFGFLIAGVDGIGVGLMTLSAPPAHGRKEIGLLCARQSAEPQEK